MSDGLFDAPFVSLAAQMGLPADQLKLVVGFLASSLFAYIQLYFIRGASARHVFSITMGLLLAFIQYTPEDVLELLASTAAVYALLLVVPRRHAFWPVFVFCMTMLSYVHLRRMFADMVTWRMDAASTHMINITKLTSLAYAYQDGETIKTAPNRIPQESKNLVVDKLPSVLEYFSYIFFYPSILIGPTFEFADYLRFVRLENEFAAIPSPVAASSKALGSALLCAGVVIVSGTWFFPDTLVTEEYAAMSLLEKLAFMNITGFLLKVRYTSAWKFNEAAMIASGLGYTPNDPKPWARAVSINWYKVEFGANAKEVADNWNITVATWIRRCFYNRILASSDKVTPTRRSMAQHLSYLASAFWHGFHPTYYMMFFLFSFHAEIGKMVHKTNWDFLPFKTGFGWIAWFLNWQIVNSLGMCFALYSLPRAHTFFSEIYYLPVILIALAWSCFKVTGLHRKPKTA